MISDERFSKREHLLKSKEFNKVYKKGLPARFDGFVLYSLANGLEYNRLGFSIGARAVKRAMIRNRIRRLFKEIYRKSKTSLKNGFDIVLVVRRQPKPELTYDSAQTAFLKLTRGVKLTE